MTNLVMRAKIAHVVLVAAIVSSVQSARTQSGATSTIDDGLWDVDGRGCAVRGGKSGGEYGFRFMFWYQERAAETDSISFYEHQPWPKKNEVMPIPRPATSPTMRPVRSPIGFNVRSWLARARCEMAARAPAGQVPRTP